MSSPQRPRRPERPQIVLEVVERIQLTPHLVRIVAGGPGISAVQDNGQTDAYAKMIFPAPGSDLTPPYDMAALREQLPPEELPSVRTYSIRKFDLANDQIWVDSVVHGSEGAAGPWADNARPGDPLVLLGIGGGYAPDPEADWHLLAGDEAAIPAIAAALEGMPADARGVVLLEVADEDEHVELTVPDGVEVCWLHREGRDPGTTDLLIDAVRALDWPEGRVQVFIHGERGAMKQLRPHLTEERGVDRSQLSLSAYWAYGRREDKFQAEKREEIGKI